VAAFAHGENGAGGGCGCPPSCDPAGQPKTADLFLRRRLPGLYFINGRVVFALRSGNLSLLSYAQPRAFNRNPISGGWFAVSHRGRPSAIHPSGQFSRRIAGASLAGEVFFPRDKGEVFVNCGAIHRIEPGSSCISTEARGISLEQCSCAHHGAG
jgi:hypothetical protein